MVRSTQYWGENGRRVARLRFLTRQGYACTDAQVRTAVPYLLSNQRVSVHRQGVCFCVWYSTSKYLHRYKGTYLGTYLRAYVLSMLCMYFAAGATLKKADSMRARVPCPACVCASCLPCGEPWPP